MIDKNRNFVLVTKNRRGETLRFFSWKSAERAGFDPSTCTIERYLPKPIEVIRG